MRIPKRALKKYLYEFKVPISYNKTIQAIEACVADTPLPSKVTPDVLMRIKRALENYRQTMGQVSASQAEAELGLVERAAELGDKTAIALLCYSRLADPECLEEDKRDGSRLLRELSDQGFALAFKVSADLAYKMGHPDALNLYKRALSLPGGLDDRTRTECWRSIAHIAFRNQDLEEALEYFSNACRNAADPAQVADCHFYLAQLRETNREASRAHLERAAASGLSDAFLPLGMLLLNYFQDPAMAQHWLRLALVTDPTGQAALGLLDIAARTNNTALGREAAGRIRAHKNAKQLAALRPESINRFASKAPHVLSAGRWE